ncbi:MAG: SMC family ATPase [Nitrososphaerota archaeon]
MRILGVYMKNVRSYPEATVVFPPEGITVIYGPTGSGKTSILMSISHALFGSPGVSKSLFDAYEQPGGADLLRAGAQEGSVRVLMNVRGRLYAVERRFRRSGDEVRFEGGLIEEYAIDKETGEIRLEKRYPTRSRDELDRKVMEIIGIKEKLDRSSTVKATVFTSALYVPQFNIHEILEHDPKTRREVVEKALGLEKYKVMKNNIKNICDQLGNRIKDLRKELDQLTHQLSRINKDQLRRELEEIEIKVKEVKLKREEMKKRKEDLEDMERRLNRDREALISKESELKSKSDLYTRIQAQIRDLVERAKRNASAVTSLLGLSIVETQDFTKSTLVTLLEKLREKKNAVLTEKERLDSELTRLESTIANLEAEERSILMQRGNSSGELGAKKQRLKKLEDELIEKKSLLEKGTCPLCLQPISHQHGYKLISDTENEIMRVKSEISELEAELEKLNSRMTELRRNIENTKREYNDKKLKLNQVRELEVKLDYYERELNSYMEDLDRLEQEAKAVDIDKIKAELEEVKRKIDEVNSSIQNVRNEKKYLENQLIDLTMQLGSLTKEKENIENQLGEAEKLEKDLSEKISRRDKYMRLQDTLSKLVELVEYLEKEVLRLLAREFKDLFSKYVRILLHDQPLEATVTDDFGLVFKVLVGSRSHDIRSLSGGQNIALSLAYRLALNATVRAYSPHLKKSVLILDEPTTGFSRELVVRLRELLEELGSVKLGQVVVVTHDKTLMEVGDCKIKLELDASKLETKIDYEECVYGGGDLSFGEYRRYIEDILRGKVRNTMRFETAQP